MNRKNTWQGSPPSLLMVNQSAEWDRRMSPKQSTVSTSLSSVWYLRAASHRVDYRTEVRRQFSDVSDSTIPAFDIRELVAALRSILDNLETYVSLPCSLIREDWRIAGNCAARHRGGPTISRTSLMFMDHRWLLPLRMVLELEVGDSVACWGLSRTNLRTMHTSKATLVLFLVRNVSTMRPETVNPVDATIHTLIYTSQIDGMMRDLGNQKLSRKSMS